MRLGFFRTARNKRIIGALLLLLITAVQFQEAVAEMFLPHAEDAFQLDLHHASSAESDSALDLVDSSALQFSGGDAQGCDHCGTCHTLNLLLLVDAEQPIYQQNQLAFSVYQRQDANGYVSLLLRPPRV